MCSTMGPADPFHLHTMSVASDYSSSIDSPHNSERGDVMKRQSLKDRDIDELLMDASQLSFDERERVLSDFQAVDPKETDELLAKRLTHLSLEERDEGLHDLHGVSDVLAESADLVETKLRQLQSELNSITIKNAYDLALQTVSEYVNDRKFRIMFLRADRFHVKHAARRIVKYFEEKLRLFGPDKLCRRILMEDLNEDDIAALKSGYLILLPERDRAGRPIIFVMVNRRTFRYPENAVRYFQRCRGYCIAPYVHKLSKIASFSICI